MTVKEYDDPIKVELDVENVEHVQKIADLFEEPYFMLLYETFCGLKAIEEKAQTNKFEPAFEELNRLTKLSYAFSPALETFYLIGKAFVRNGDQLKVEALGRNGKRIFKNFGF
jgi:hypothetical protein